MAGWSSGWVAAAGNNTSTPFNHTLNSTDVTWQIYVAEDDQGSNAITMDVQFDHLQSTIDTFGAMLSNITKTSFNLQLGASYLNSMFNHGEISFAGKYVKVVAIAAGSEAAGTEVKFIEPYDITPVDGAWTKIDAQPAWANSNARTLVVKAETYDFDTGGNADQSLKARTSAASTIEVDIITHGGTSGGRSVASEQALIPCSEDGSFEYFWYRSDTTNGKLRHFKVIGYVQRSPFLTGTGDLCKLFPDDSGYQMFRNGLTMQWMSSPAFTTESTQVVNFPIPFASKPFKVVASTRYPNGDAVSQTFFQVVSWTKDGATIFAQSGVAAFNPVYADIIAIGIAEVTGCSASGGGGGGGDVDGIKVSQLTNAAELKDDDLFLLSRDNETDGSYDISKNVKLSELSSKITSSIPPPTPTSTFTFIDPVEIYSHSGFVILPWTTKDLSAHIPEGATGCIINITYSISGPDDGVPAKTLLRAKSGAFVYTALFAGAWAGGDAVGGNSQGLYPINAETRSIDISIPVRSPNSQNVYLIGYF